LGGSLLAQVKAPVGATRRQLLEGGQFEGPPVQAPEPFRKLMKSNDAIMSVDAAPGGDGAAAGAPGGVQTTFRGTLSGKLGAMPDFDAALKDAAALKANFAEIEAYFVMLKSPEAVERAKSGTKALLDLETAARAKDRTGAVRAQIAVARACRDCHIGHRILVITQPLQFGIIS
jgi:hypothetical protein